MIFFDLTVTECTYCTYSNFKYASALNYVSKDLISGKVQRMTSDFSDELEALLSIYPNHIVVLGPSGVNDQHQQQYITVQYSYKELSSEDNSANLIWAMDRNYVLSLNIPLSYPNIDLGMDKITLSLSFTTRMDSEVRERILHELYQVINNNAGEVIIYLTIQRLLEMMDIYSEEENYSAVRTSTTPDVPLGLEITSGYDTAKPIDTSVFNDILGTRIDQNIIHGPVTTEQKSSFQAHICYVRSMEDVAEFRTSVLSDKRIARATHNIFAYRFSCDATG